MTPRSLPDWVEQLVAKWRDPECPLSREGWQPIETAPKDGTTVTGWTPYASCRVGDVFWNRDLEQWARLPNADQHIAPTHWRLLDPPVAALNGSVREGETKMSDPTEHTLTLKFGRFLSESEWRNVVEQARQLPYVKELEANAIDAKLIEACRLVVKTHQALTEIQALEADHVALLDQLQDTHD